MRVYSEQEGWFFSEVFGFHQVQLIWRGGSAANEEKFFGCREEAMEFQEMLLNIRRLYDITSYHVTLS